MSTLRPAAVAGSFYPGDAAILTRDLKTYFDAVPPVTEGNPRGTPTFAPPKALIVPHAGYIYSGSTAAAAYARLKPLAGHIRRVVLLGPGHRVAVRGLAVPSVDRFATPLGEIPLDRAAIDSLADLPQVVVNDAAHAQEHSLEVQLPFLQSVLGSFSLIPLAVGQSNAGEVAQVLDRLWGSDETLILISSDLSHFHPYDEATQIDGKTVADILALRPLTHFEQACGALPINGVLEIARQRGLSIELVAQCNSGDTAGDKSRVVGYASFALTDSLGPALLTRARNAIAAKLGQAALMEPSNPALSHPGATFVTLTQNGALRGCIGSLEAHRALDTDVRENGLAAAFRDPRFPPLTAEELARTRVEVSLLTPPQAMSFKDETDALTQLRPLQDGVIFIAGNRRSTFLPQVWEQLPDRKVFMSHLKQKAGLPADFWSPDVKLLRYQVRKWKEA
jgi:AmmeMemoRadiSam system protein B/AmmeMemoRadiSam system protein A